MIEQTDSINTPELILQRLDKIAAELQLLRQAIITTQEHSGKVREQNTDVTDTGSGKYLPDLREFRASLTVQGNSLQAVVLREREEQRY